MTEGTYRDGVRAMLPLLPAIVAFGAATLLKAPLLVVVLVAAGLRAIQ